MSSPESATAEAPAVDPEDGWRRLDRRTIWVAPLRPLGTLLLTGLVVITFRGWDKVGFVEPVIGLVLAAGGFAHSAWSWATTRYRITATHVELRGGILVRTHRAVARDRLRTVDITADLLHRIAGLAVVAVGTGRQGGESDDELKLESLARRDADELRTVLLARRTVAPAPVADAAAPTPPPADELSRFDPRWVLLAPLSLMGLVAVAVVAGAGAQLLRTALGDEVFASAPVRALWDWVTSFSVLLVLGLAAVVLLVANAVLSPVLYVLVYGGFRLTRHDDSLHVSYGLITQRSVTIEERRIRGVRLAEPLLLRAVKAGRLAAVAAGLGAKKDSEGKEKGENDMLLPTAPVAEAHRVAAAVLRSAESPLAAPLRRHPVAALRPIALQWSVFALPAVVLGILAALDVVAAWLPEAALVLVVAGVLGAALEYANLGHARSGDYLVARHGSGVRTTTAVRCDGIIAWQFRRSVFQRRPRLLTATAAVAAGKGAHTIRYADQDGVLLVARDAVPGLLDAFLEPDT
ncbi:PH domain-containing protein [Pseudonocardia sp. CA-107938]|uniref:PH domain-containing protein n=1 Tax=Pseudonocardia sp. CA-107938 TaxID=3240021 RepID=UPI003D8F58F9